VPTPGGGGQVLIKSVNGKVVITPVPGTGNNPPLPLPASAVAATPTPAVVKPASPMTVAMKTGGGGGGPVVNGGGEQHSNNNNSCNSSGDNGQVGLHSSPLPKHPVYVPVVIKTLEH
jgi:hypothetical protein